MLSDSGKSLTRGVSILSIAGILCKLLGLLFTIPLTRTIGSEGLGIFQSVYPTYNLLLTLSSAGLPVAVSRMVSSYLAKDDPRNAHRVFKTALWLLTALGSIFMFMMLGGTDLLTEWVKEPRASLGFIAIAPCLPIVCALSAFRGFMQGQQDMKPTALSQIVEQVGKLVFSLPLALLGARTSLAYGAAGALLGITISEAIATLSVCILYFRRRSSFVRPQLSGDSPISSKALSFRLFAISVPITVSACIVPLAQFVDSVMMVPRMMISGLAYDEARSLYGVFSGLVIRHTDSLGSCCCHEPGSGCFCSSGTSRSEKNAGRLQSGVENGFFDWFSMLHWNECAGQRNICIPLLRKSFSRAFSDWLGAFNCFKPYSCSVYRCTSNQRYFTGTREAAHPNVYFDCRC